MTLTYLTFGRLTLTRVRIGDATVEIGCDRELATAEALAELRIEALRHLIGTCGGHLPPLDHVGYLEVA